jgi:hypothetical protein
MVQALARRWRWKKNTGNNRSRDFSLQGDGRPSYKYFVVDGIKMLYTVKPPGLTILLQSPIQPIVSQFHQKQNEQNENIPMIDSRLLELTFS